MKTILMITLFAIAAQAQLFPAQFPKRIFLKSSDGSHIRFGSRILQGKDGSKGCIELAPSAADAMIVIELSETRRQGNHPLDLPRTRVDGIITDTSGWTTAIYAESFSDPNASRGSYTQMLKLLVKEAGCKAYIKSMK